MEGFGAPTSQLSMSLRVKALKQKFSSRVFLRMRAKAVT